jgi:hypothetical protein
MTRPKPLLGEVEVEVQVERGKWILVAHEAQPLKAFSLQSIYLSSLEVGGGTRRG